ncbi:MAG TPA: primosomal protein N' [Candidatus Nitrosopolaris sp.]|nr:primosomal protein N' [Candidatus Nitrosopolaris sp.]
MRYYEVFVADGHYHGNTPLTYSSEETLKTRSVVTVQLRARMVTGFVLREVKRPDFTAKPIKTLLSSQPLPPHCLELAKWLEDYYLCTAGEAMRQFAPSRPTIRRSGREATEAETGPLQLEMDKPLTADQKKALTFIRKNTSVTTLLHGDTGTGKTRVYLELAHETLKAGKSVILLTPEIALTTQLAAAVEQQLPNPVYVLHSQLTAAQRKHIWLAILEAKQPVVIIGPRSALFSPVKDLGLIVLDEAHEPAYKQEKAPRYHAARVASQLGALAGAKVVLGTATPLVSDYYLAQKRGAIARMTHMAVSDVGGKVETEIVDLKERHNFSRNPYLSNQLIDAITTTLSAKKQIMLYLNRRGTAHLILCRKCGWQLLCPNCDIPLVYHGDHHQVRCHSCGYSAVPPLECPVCASPDIIYRSMGTKALLDNAAKLFPQFRLARFDSDNLAGERVHETYAKLRAGEIDILVGTQLLAKGFDLPKLGLVGVIAADTSMGLPDYSSEERTFQLLYQVMGRVGRGHGKGRVVLQTYEPDSPVVRSAISHDWQKFYKYLIRERQDFRWPPFAYLLQLTCRRATAEGAQKAANNLKAKLINLGLPVEIIGPTPAFYARRGKYYYYQLVAKSKNREHLVQLARNVPHDWTINLDPSDLL